MGFTLWLKSFTLLEIVLTALIIISAIIAGIWFTIFFGMDTKSKGKSVDRRDYEEQPKTGANFFYVPGILDTLREGVLEIIPENEMENQEKESQPSLKNSIIEKRKHSNGHLVAALFHVKTHRQNCSCIIVAEYFAITTSTCSRPIKDCMDYAFSEYDMSKSNELAMVILHHQYREDNDFYDVAVLKSVMAFKKPSECYAGFLSPIPAVMMKVGDAVIVVSWDSTNVQINGTKEWSLIPYEFATFINYERELLDLCASKDHKIDKENICGISQKPEAVAAPIFKGKYAYGLIGANKKIVILANHLHWFENIMMGKIDLTKY